MTTTAKERPGIPDPDQTPAGMPVGDERRLVARAQQGDRDAFDRLVEAHLKHVWSVVWRIVRHQEDAEDVVQEVFLSAFQALPRYRGESRLSTWLHRIAVTRALNHLDRSEERLRRRAHSLDGSMDEGVPHPDGRDGWPSGRTPSPLQALEARDLARRLADCVARLPAAWRAVLALRDVEAHSYEEIAELVGVAIGTVRSRLARARLALRQCVTEETT